MSVDEVTLDVEHFHSMSRTSSEMLHNTSINAEEVVDAIGKMLVVQVVTRVASYDLEQNQVSYPADWWEAFKESWFPAWAKRRWPVRYTTERITIKALYPDLPVDVDSRVFVQAFKGDVE